VMAPLLVASTIQELDLKFLELAKLLSKPAANQQAFLERMQGINLAAALDAVHTDDRLRRSLETSDYMSYLTAVVQDDNEVHLPPSLQETFGEALVHVSPERVFRITSYPTIDTSNSDTDLNTIIEDCAHINQLIVGESGIGKSLLCSYVTRSLARLTCNGDSVTVPVVINLSLYSRANSLRVLLTEALRKYLDSALVQVLDIDRDLRRGRFLLICDAYDEVATEYIPELDRELALLQELPKVRFLLTSREGRIPTLTRLKKYRVKPLSAAAVRIFAIEQLGLRSAGNLIQQIQSLRLEPVATSTLVTALLILLYKLEHELPADRFAIVERIVELVIARQSDKLKDFETHVPIDMAKQTLGELGMKTSLLGDAYILTGKITNEVIRICCKRFVEDHFSSNITSAKIVASIIATGFVRVTDENGLVFWHRAFMEHFAIQGLISALNANDIDLGIVAQSKMQPLVSVALSKILRVDIYADVLRRNAFCLADALNHSTVENLPLVELVLPHLQKCAGSKIPQIALLALRTVARAPGKRVEQYLRERLDNGTVDQKVLALRLLVQRGVPDARRLVFDRLDWDDPVSLYSDRTTRTVLVECLGYLGDEDSQLKILTLFARHKDMYTEWEVEKILGRIAAQGTLTPAALTQLKYLAKTKDAEMGWMHRRVVISIMAMTQRADILAWLIQEMDNTERHLEEDAGSDSYAWEISWTIRELLKESRSEDVIQVIRDCLMQDSLSKRTRLRLYEILTESPIPVDFDFAIQIARSDAPLAAAQGILMLSRYEFNRIEAELEKELRYCAGEPSNNADASAMMHRQRAVIEALIRHRRLTMLLLPEFRLKLFGLDALETLLKATIEHHLFDLRELIAELARRSRNRITLSPRHAKIATLLMTAQFVLGDEQEGAILLQDILDIASTDPFVVQYLIEATHHMESERALDVLKVVRSHVIKPTSHYLEDTWIGAVERTGTRAARDCLIRCIDDMRIERPDDFRMERYLRALQSLGDATIEGWLLDMVKDSRLHGLSINRIIGLLGMYGDHSSLTALQEFLDRDYRIGAVFDAMQAIHLRKGRVWYAGWENGCQVS
jgi:hypothetical protein